MKWNVVLSMLCTVQIASAQFDSPWITEGPVNAARYKPADWPGSGIAQGSVFIVKGMVLGPTPIVTATSFPLQTELGGTSMEVTIGGTTVKPYLIYTSYSQVAGLLPSNTPLGGGTLRLSYEGKTASPKSIRVVRSSFGIFSVNQGGTGPGVIQNVNSETNRPVNALHLPALRNQVVILWGTGLGAVTGEEHAGVLVGELPVPVEVFVGGRPANILYKGRSGCCAGIDQIVVEVPPSVEGCYVPVAVKVNHTVSNFVSMAIASESGDCPDPPVLAPANMAKVRQGNSVNLARLEVMRTEVEFSMDGMTMKALMDVGMGSFVRYRPYELMRGTDVHSYWRAGAPSPGGCAILPATSNEDLVLPLYEDPYSNGPAGLQPARLDAGSQLYLTGTNGTKTFSRVNRQYFGFFGGLNPEEGMQPTYLDPGEYTIDNRDGGTEVGAFKIVFTVPEPLVWLNQDSIHEVDRAADLTVSWRSRNPEGEVVTLLALSASEDGLPTALLCTERAAAGQMTIPAWILSAMRPSESFEGIPMGFLGVMNSPVGAESRFTAPGIDAGLLQALQGKAKFLPFR